MVRKQLKVLGEKLAEEILATMDELMEKYGEVKQTVLTHRLNQIFLERYHELYNDSHHQAALSKRLFNEVLKIAQRTLKIKRRESKSPSKLPWLIRLISWGVFTLAKKTIGKELRQTKKVFSAKRKELEKLQRTAASEDSPRSVLPSAGTYPNIQSNH